MIVWWPMGQASQASPHLSQASFFDDDDSTLHHVTLAISMNTFYAAVRLRPSPPSYR